MRVTHKPGSWHAVAPTVARGLATTEAVAGLTLLGIEASLSRTPGEVVAALGWAAIVVLGTVAARLAVRLLRASQVTSELPAIVSVTLVFAVSFGSVRLAAALALLVDLIALVRWVRRDRPGQRVLVDVGHRPARALVLSFTGLIGVGTVLLALPASSSGDAIAWIDAFFTAVSATCVTGLTTVDTATAWSPFGLGVILGLIQLGGLGIMAVSAAMTLAFGRHLGLQQDAVMRGTFDESDAEELRALLRTLVGSTVAIEAGGAALLFLRFGRELPFGEALLASTFHSISAFCNAGFALYSDNLVRFGADPLVSGTVMVLITLGGLGFGVLVTLGRYVRSRGRQRLTAHAKVVLVTSAALVWVGGIAYFFFEYDRSLAHLGLGGKALAALFQSVTARTAGFNSVPLDLAHPVTILVLIALMIVGASPGSTGGGIKTTTFALVILAARAYLRDRADVEVFGRRIPSSLVMRALAVCGGATLAYFLGLAVLLTTEAQQFAPLMFETASALGTVGLSLGVTPKLTVIGRLVVAGLMFAGRVGPLTIASAAAARRGITARVVLPEGKVLIG
ncbi:MAG: potassium transporter TrkG [Myxococcota bacterium]